MNLQPTDTFARRHLGPSPAEQSAMLEAMGVGSLDELMDQTIPAAIRRTRPMDLPPAESESTYLARLTGIAAKNRVCRSCIGLGYFETLTPSANAYLYAASIMLLTRRLAPDT